MERNAYVDERFDPEKSTRAYARYMKFNYDQLGDWYLAMAAYDHGAGNIQREVQKTGYADFWELYKRHEMPRETGNYVPEILAAILVANHPDQYGFSDVTLDPPVLTDTVTVNYSINLRLVADLVGSTVDEIEALNPSLLRTVTPPETAFDLHLPAGTATLFEQRAALIPEAKRNAWRYHAVVAGDSLASVAQEYRVTAAELASANQLKPGDSIAGLEALAVPVAPAPESAINARLYTVRRGDTLVTIADRFGVSLSQLRRWNGIPSGVKVQPGRRIRVAEPASTTRSSAHRRKTSTAGAKTGPAAGAKTPAPSSGQAPAAHKPAGATTAKRRSHTSSAASKAKSNSAHKPAKSGTTAH